MGFNCKSNILTENDKVRNPTLLLGQIGGASKASCLPAGCFGAYGPSGLAEGLEVLQHPQTQVTEAAAL